jgi:F-type H+-transporting ATPase subunit epsilon
MTTLTAGSVRFKRKGSNTTEAISVSWGYCEVVNNVVNILAETAESSSEIDLKRAEEALKKSEKMMVSDVDPAQLEKYRLKRERALVRISVARMNQ